MGIVHHLRPASSPRTAALPPAAIRPACDVSGALLALPTLGPVLCQCMPTVGPRAWSVSRRHPLPDHPWLRAVPALVRVRACVSVDGDGPQECLEGLDAAARTRLRVWLLPDSDFCAWDRLLARHGLETVAPDAGSCGLRATHRHWMQGRHAGRAVLARFDVRERAGLRWLGLAAAGAVSPLGRRRAHQLAAQWRLGDVLERVPG